MKLKQKIASCLCILYLIMVTGVALNMHYCGGRLSSVKVNESAKCSICKKAGEDVRQNNCCKTTLVEVKLKDSHQAGIKAKMPQDFGMQLFILPHLFGQLRPALQAVFSNFVNKAPPLSSILSLHLFNCVFRN